jgi:hypothetical protein
MKMRPLEPGLSVKSKNETLHRSLNWLKYYSMSMGKETGSNGIECTTVRQLSLGEEEC